MTTPTPRPANRILIISAHPDDPDFSCAGSTAAWTDAGATVGYCICTDGDAGGEDPTMTREQIGAMRREEQRAAGKAVGVTDIEFLGHRDGELTATLDLRRDITRVIRRFRPDRVITNSPIRDLRSMYASHPDHLAAGEAALCAVYPDSRNPFAHPELLAEGFEPHTVPEVWLMGGPEPDTVVDVTDTFSRKVAALRCHVSQVGHREDLEEMLRGWLTMIAKANGLPEGRLAEAFRMVPTA